jgi:hypothetical protein
MNIQEIINSMPDKDRSQLSDGYHTFSELYEFRKTYNAAAFNAWYTMGYYSVHKSFKHHDGELCFDGDWFIVSAMLPTGQISNHYHISDWNLFKCKETSRSLFPFDNHTSTDVLNRIKNLYEQNK